MTTTKEKTQPDKANVTERAIRSVRVFSSGSAEQHKEHRYGTVMPRLWWVLTSRSWLKVPINYFLIEHRDGPVLFDTGLDPAIATNERYISSPIGDFCCAGYSNSTSPRRIASTRFWLLTVWLPRPSAPQYFRIFISTISAVSRIFHKQN